MSTPVFSGIHLSEDFRVPEDLRSDSWIIYITYEKTVWGVMSD